MFREIYNKMEFMQASFSNKERIVSLDIVRGIAMFGILLINVPAILTQLEGGPTPDYSGFNGIIDFDKYSCAKKVFLYVFFFVWGRVLYFCITRRKSWGSPIVTLF